MLLTAVVLVVLRDGKRLGMRREREIHESN